jgi:hypothetical protein
MSPQCKGIVYLAIAGGVAWLAWKQRQVLTGTFSGLTAGVNTLDTPQNVCAQWRGTFSPGTQNREPLCRRIGMPGVRRRANLPADSVEIVPGMVVRDTSLPTAVNGKCPKFYDLFRFSDGHSACLRKCPVPQLPYENDADVTRAYRNRSTGRCSVYFELAAPDAGGGGSGGD